MRKKDKRIDELPEHPVSALEELANAGMIQRPVYDGHEREDGGYLVSVTIAGVKQTGVVAVGIESTKYLAKRAAARAVLVIVLETMCPNPTRPRFATREVADDEIRRQQAIRKGKPLVRSYLCRCGWFHCTGKGATQAGAR